jgi:hypothetical protein
MRSLKITVSICFVGLLLVTASCWDEDVIDSNVTLKEEIEVIDKYLEVNNINAV